MSIKTMGTMICENCKEDRKDSDFLMGNKECYKCVYKKKTEIKKEEEKKDKKVLCRICNGVVRLPKLVFCSDECAHIGFIKQKKAYWHRNIRIEKINVRNFQY